MSEKRIVLKAIVDTEATNYAIEFLRNFKLSQLEIVKIIPAEPHKVIVNFYFKTSDYNSYNEIVIKNAFCVGYRDEGSMGLHDVLIDSGFDKSTVSKVFTVSCCEQTVLQKIKPFA